MEALELEARLDNILATAQAETANLDIFAPIMLREECPICLLPLPIKHDEIAFNACCGKNICLGCIYKNITREKDNADHPSKIGLCAICRQPIINGNNYIKRLKKLMKKKHPEAFMEMAAEYKSGERTLQSNTKALEMYICAAELGHADAFINIGCFHLEGVVVEQDISKAVEYYEVAAKKGSVNAHKRLVYFHGRNGDIQTSIKHCRVAASAGDQESMDNLMRAYKDKSISKEELTQTLRAHQTSSNEIKSKDRDEAISINKQMDRSISSNKQMDRYNTFN